MASEKPQETSPSSPLPAPQTNPLVPVTRQQRFITDNVAKDNSIMYNGDIIIKAINELKYVTTLVPHQIELGDCFNLA